MFYDKQEPANVCGRGGGNTLDRPTRNRYSVDKGGGKWGQVGPPVDKWPAQPIVVSVTA